MALYYSELLTRERILEISEKHGFSAELLVGKFILCFEIHRHITQEIDCTTRGGMCMPFHQPNFEVRRMSKDIDILSRHSEDELERVMDGIGSSVDGLGCRKLVPESPLPIENFVSYNITYDSCFGGEGRVKVDAFCGADLNLNTQHVLAGSQILDFEILQEMTILSRGSLVADKITALALGTTGIRAERKTEIVKQIYDIATLLRQASRKDLAVAYGAYQELTEFKVGCFRRNPRYTVPDISSSIAQSLGGFLQLDTNALVAQSLLMRYNSFRGDYLSRRHSYEKSDHIADVLLVRLFALSLQRRSTESPPPSKASETDYLHSVLENLGPLRSAEAEDARRLREEYLNEIPGRFINRRLVRNSPLEHVYLIKELASVP